MTNNPRFSLCLDLQLSQILDWAERGSVRYTTDHARALIKRPGLVSGIALNPVMPFPKDLHPELRMFEGLHWGSAGAFSSLEAGGPVAYHMMSPFADARPECLLPPYALGKEVPLIVTLVDMTPLTSPDPSFSRPDIKLRYQIRFQIIQEADLILTISENTRREALELLPLRPERVINIGTGVSDFFSPGDPQIFLEMIHTALPEISRPFVFAVTGTWEWKNTHRLIEAFAALPGDLRRRLQLVVTCRLNDEYRAKWTNLAKSCGLSPGDVVLTDLVSDDVLRSLYRSADLFVLPSLYEGFGLPAAEAAACGSPCIVSRTSSLPEILQHPPATFNPEDPADISQLMEKALVDQEFNRQLRAAADRARSRNTWAAVAERTQAALQTLDEFSSRPSRSRKPRIAFAVGVENLRADGRLGLARELSRLAELDMAVAGKTDFEPIRAAIGGRCFPIEALGRWLNPAGYDAILYDAGGPALEQIEDKALMYPGIMMIDSMNPSQLYPASGKETSAIVKILRSARGICAATQQQLRMVELNLGPRVPVGPLLVLGETSGPSAAARSVVDFVSRIPAA